MTRKPPSLNLFIESADEDEFEVECEDKGESHHEKSHRYETPQKSPRYSPRKKSPRYKTHSTKSSPLSIEVDNINLGYI